MCSINEALPVVVLCLELPCGSKVEIKLLLESRVLIVFMKFAVFVVNVFTASEPSSSG